MASWDLHQPRRVAAGVRQQFRPLLARLPKSLHCNKFSDDTSHLPGGGTLRVGWRQQVRTEYMAIEQWSDAIEIHPSQIRVGDVIGTRRPTDLRLTVKMISGPQSGPGQWTFFSRDDNGQQRTSTFDEGELVRRYVKAS